MNCFDCRPDALRPVPTAALAVCARCGAGICGTHVHLSADPLPAPAGSSAPPAEARRLTCGVCYTAERAAADRLRVARVHATLG